MWWYFVQNIVLSVCIIIAIHSILEYCKTQYTPKKTKRIVDTQTQKYRDIIRNIQESHTNPPSDTLDYIHDKDKMQMIGELTKLIHSPTEHS
jgi:hypothetical protein